MPATDSLTPFTVHPGGATAPGQFVIRWRGVLVRADGGLPLLFGTEAEAGAEVEQLKEAYHG